MKPRNKLQREVMRLSNRYLFPIHNEHERWALSKTTPLYVISRNRHFCLECGHKWNEGIKMSRVMKHCTCPACKTKLQYYSDNTVKQDAYYMAVMETCQDYQVIRILLVEKYLKKNHQFTSNIREVMQHWITIEGVHEVLSVPTHSFCGAYDSFGYGDLEPRSMTWSHEMRIALSPSDVYPKMGLLPIVKRNGFNGQFYGSAPAVLLSKIMYDSRFETLVKAKQHSLAHLPSYTIQSFWPQIKICIRHKYKVKDASMWVDYINLLRAVGKDIRNPKFVCPKKLKKEHDKYLQANKEAEREQKLRDKQKREEVYQKEKRRFFGIMIKSKDIVIEPLKSIEEFKKESEALHHCVYNSNYYSRKNSLILSARIEGRSIETIEVDLQNNKVVQCRGEKNKPTDRHDEIVSIVEKNLPLIVKCKTA